MIPLPGRPLPYLRPRPSGGGEGLDAGGYVAIAMFPAKNMCSCFNGCGNDLSEAGAGR